MIAVATLLSAFETVQTWHRKLLGPRAVFVLAASSTHLNASSFMHGKYTWSSSQVGLEADWRPITQ
jgi:hypothetical protein